MGVMDEARLLNVFGQNIRRFRKRKGLSQEKLAEKMNISTNYLSDVERGKNLGSPNLLVRLAAALEIEVFELFRPQEKAPADVSAKVNKCLEDFSSSLRVSFEKSIADSIREIQKNL